MIAEVHLKVKPTNLSEAEELIQKFRRDVEAIGKSCSITSVIFRTTEDDKDE
jgi:hypothetical protein